MINHRLAAAAMLSLALTSCFKDEPANAECDIERAWIHVENPLDMFHYVADTLWIADEGRTDNISFRVKAQTDLTAIAPMFTLTPGAAIEPASGTVRDFSQGPLAYTVTSEDRQYKRTYMVEFNVVDRTLVDTLHYDFENFTVDALGYYVWSDIPADRTPWATANAGYYIPYSNSNLDPSDYPTAVEPDGFDGNAVRLTTRSTGVWGETFRKPIAAGNLFVGSFDAGMVVLRPLQATRFGSPIDRKPLKLRGYYKYQPGETFQDADRNVVEGRTDKPSMYAVFYRNRATDDGELVTLDGSDVRSNSLIVAQAEPSGIAPTDEWTPFEADFVYTSAVDAALLANRGYSFTIVFSASSDGDLFQGAVGSTLCIDKVELIFSPNDDENDL